jgi:hypothetical protein
MQPSALVSLAAEASNLFALCGCTRITGKEAVVPTYYGNALVEFGDIHHDSPDEKTGTRI